MHGPACSLRGCQQRGFTYLWLLLILAFGSAGLAALGQRTSVAVQRDREAELIFRGQAIARAISAYRAATPGDAKTLPASLQDLLDDRRNPNPAHHLRRLYADPFTGKADWMLVATEDGRIKGVRSRSQVAALRTIDLPTPGPGELARVGDRVFMFTPVLAADGAASAPTGPSRAVRGPRDGPDTAGAALPPAAVAAAATASASAAAD